MKSLFTTKGLAVIGFLLVFFVFLLNSRICSGYEEEPAVSIGEAQPRMIDDDEAPRGIIETVCRVKRSVGTSLVIAFLVLTVIRQVMVRMTGR